MTMQCSCKFLKKIKSLTLFLSTCKLSMSYQNLLYIRHHVTIHKDHLFIFCTDFLWLLPYNHLSVSTFKFYLKILFKKFHSNAQGITQLLRCRLAHETDRMERETLAEPYRHRRRANAANGTVEGRALLQPCTRSIGGGVLHLRSYVRFLEERWRGCNRRLRCCWWIQLWTKIGYVDK